MDSWLLAPFDRKQVVAMRNSQERSNRLENLCWRIWHVARKKKQVRLSFGEKARLHTAQGMAPALLFFRTCSSVLPSSAFVLRKIKMNR